MDSYKYVIKFVINGTQGVGKSCLMKQFIDQKFDQNYDQTIGVEYGSKMLNIREIGIKLQIWDRAGAETFRAIVPSYYRGTMCALSVYDVTSRDSFEYSIERLLQVRNYSNQQIIIVLVANKIDLPNRVISTEEGEQQARENNVLYFETSAKTGFNVDKIFTEAASLVLEKIDNGEINVADEIFGIKRGPQSTLQITPAKRYSKCF